MSSLIDRIGQQNAVRVVSSLNGISVPVGIPTYADRSGISTNVIGGIASVTQLDVTGIATFRSKIRYTGGNYEFPNGVAYFGVGGTLVSSASTISAVDTTGFIFTTNELGIPSWSSKIDGGTY
jgi:hypothetical protein